MTPAVSEEKMDVLISKLAEFEEHIDNDSKLSDVLPKLYESNEMRYRGYTIRELCQEMHDYYKKD